VDRGIREIVGISLDFLMDEIEKVFWKFRKFVRKQIIRKVNGIDATCDVCGRKVHDFIAPDEDWIKVVGHEGGILCYDCFCEMCKSKKIFPVWVLERYEKKYPHLM